MKTVKITTSIIILMMGLSSVAFASFDVNLKVGSRGDEVKKVQRFLNLGETGYFGVGTLKLVKDFQKKNSLPPTGLWGAGTRKIANNSSTTTPVQTSIQLASTSPTTPPVTSTSTEEGVGIVTKDGVKILSPLKKYGFYQEIVRGEKDGLVGSYNQTTKVFISDLEAKRIDDAYQAKIRHDSELNSTVPPPAIPALPEFEIADGVVPASGNAFDLNRAKHTVVCGYGNKDAGIKDYQIKNELKKLLDNAPIFTTSENNITVNLTKVIDPTIYDELGMVYNKIFVCGVINNKNGYRDYIYKSY